MDGEDEVLAACKEPIAQYAAGLLTRKEFFAKCIEALSKAWEEAE